LLLVVKLFVFLFEELIGGVGRALRGLRFGDSFVLPLVVFNQRNLHRRHQFAAGSFGRLVWLRLFLKAG
jgi:hypothetical protein